MAEKIYMIALSPTMNKGTIARWNKKPGDFISSGDVICSVETDKTTMDYESTMEGTLLHIVVPDGGTAEIGQTIAIIGEKGEDFADLLKEETPLLSPEANRVPESEKEEKIPHEEEISGEEGDRIKSSPLARKMAEQAGIRLSLLTGSGPGGRVVKRDVEEEIRRRKQEKPEIKPVAEIVVPKVKAVAPVIPVSAMEESMAVSSKRRIIAQRLSASKFSAPHYYLKLTVIADALIKAREELNSQIKDKVSFNSFLMKFTAEALKKHPHINATWNGDNIIRYRHADIGLAVAITDGLIAPVVRDCGNKGILEIDRELKILIEKAQKNILKPEEYGGATFTISNLGSFGIEEFTAIINPPGSAILAVGKIQKQPAISDDDQLVIKSVIKLTLSCDHRVIDGAVGASFLKELKDMIESPIRALY